MYLFGKKSKEESNKTVAILYLASGGYIVFWKDFYTSCERHFLKGFKKTYYVFTDATDFKYSTNANVKVIYRKHLGWPDGTLLRYHEFLKQEETLKTFDYIFFFNANMKIMKDVKSEILPDETTGGLMMGLHPCFYNKNCDEFPYERNPKSTAYIPFGEGKNYVQGCLNGGTSQEFLNLCKEIKENVDIDKKNGVDAVWFDESHLNKAVLNKKYLLMPPNYLYPQAMKIKPYRRDIKIMQIDKSRVKFGGLENMRDPNGVSYNIYSFFGINIKLKKRTRKEQNKH